MDDNKDLIELKTTNTITGEIFTTQVDPYEPNSLGNCLLDIQAMKKNLEKLEAEVKAIVMDYMERENTKVVPLSNGYDWRLVSGQRKAYNPSVVLANIDQDLLVSTGAVSVVAGKLESLMADLVRENGITPEVSHNILDSIEYSAIKPYVKLEKVKRDA